MGREGRQGIRGRGHGHAVLCGVGLACWIVTLTLHSATVTPFQRFDGLGSFVGIFALETLGIAVVVAAVVAVAALRGKSIPGRLLWGTSAVCYTVTGVGFALCALQGIDGWPAVAVGAFSLVAALGSVGTGLVWGRVFTVLGPRPSLAGVGVAGVVAAALGLAIARLPTVPCVTVFAVCVAAAVSLPLVCGMGPADSPDGDPGAAAPAASCRRPMGERLRSFADVAAPALIGLLAFAFVVGTMRALVIETHPFHLMALAVDGAVLVGFALVRLKRPFVGLAYRSLIPALAVLLLAVTNISMALFGGTAADMAMIYLLYTLAALLTLATLAAVAHAGEFPSDFVYGMPFALFCLASFAGLQCAEAMTADAIKVSTTVITTVYAFVMVILPGLRAQRLEGTDALPPPGEPGGSGRRPEVPAAGSSSVAERCAELVRTYRLTAREAEILGYLASGYGSGYISEALYISPNTVRTHIHNIYGKLGVNSREDVLDLVKG